MLAVIETHPVQYHAPVYRTLVERYAVPVAAIYGSDFSVAGYRDREFGVSFAWDTDLLAGYRSVFLSRVSADGARSVTEVSARGLGRTLAELAPAAILLSGYSPRFHQLAFAHSYLSRRPIIFRAETTDHARSRGRVKSAIRDAALRLLYRHCARLLYVGQHSLSHFQRLGVPSERLLFSPYCVAAEPFRCGEGDRAAVRCATRAELGLTSGQIALLFSGKLSARKGPDLLVAAVKTLPVELRERLVLLLLGDGELRDELLALGRADPVVKVVHVGFRNQTELSPFYHAADLLSLPSRWSETWGLAVNEALHHGLPVLVSDAVGCAPDLVDSDRTGVVVAAGSMRALAQGIQQASPLIGRADVRSWCRERVAAYSVESAAGGIAQAYHQVVG